MALAWQCDCCKKMFPYKKHVAIFIGHADWDKGLRNQYFFNENIDEPHMDVCDSCMEKVQKFIQSLGE